MYVRSRALLILAAAVVAVAVIYALDLTPWVRGGFGWRWQYDPLPLNRWFLPVILCVVYIVGASVFLRRQAALRVLTAWALVFAVALAVSVTAAQEGDAIYGLFARAISRLATGPHWLSAHVDWVEGGWRAWTTVMRESGGHLSNLPPGLPLGYAALSGLFGTFPGAANAVSGALLPYQCQNFALLGTPPAQIASASFGLLMPLWAALAVFPLASVARKLSGEQAARWSVLWWPLTPALMAFAGSFNTIYPVFTLSAVYLLIRALDSDKSSRRMLWAFACGLVAGLATFANFAFAPLPLILGLFALIYGLGVARRTFGQLVVLGAVFTAGLLIPWAIFALATGLTPLDLLRASFEFHLYLDRPYGFWVVMHVWDWLAWGGLAFGVLALVSAFRVRRAPDGGAALGAALALGMLIVTLSGTARGETGRVWLVFTPLLVIAAADGLRRIASDRAASWTLIAGANGVLAMVLALSLPVIGLDLTPPPALDSTIAARPIEAQFSAGGSPIFRLIAWDTEQTPAGLDVLLTFDADRRPTEPYYLGSILVAPDGSETPSEAQQPRDAAGITIPATCWTPGTPVTVRLTQPLPDDLATDDAYISVAVYGAKAGAGALRVITPDGPDSQIGLGPVAIPPDEM